MEDRPVPGYFIAIAAGAASFWFTGVLIVFVLHGNRVLPQSGQQVLNAMISMGIFTSVLFLIGCIMTALPFLVSRWIAKRLQVSSAAYYVGCGLVTGLLFFSLHMALALNIPQDPGDPTWADLIVGLLCYAFSGVIGSFVYWRFAVARPSVPSDRK